MNRFKGLDLVDKVPEVQTEFHNIVQEVVTSKWHKWKLPAWNIYVKKTAQVKKQ